MDTLPAFSDLPVKDGAPAHSAWGVWGDDDRLGCWNKIDEAAVRRGSAAVRKGRVFSLNAPFDAAMTTMVGRTPFRHRVQTIMGLGWDDVLDDYNTQGSTQWDGFGHFAAAVHGHYNGIARDDHGVDRWADRGFATRGVVVDVARWRESIARPLVPGDEMVPLPELHAVLDAQGSTVERGDVLLLRFGSLGLWRSGAAPSLRGLPGLEPSLALVEALWDWHVAAVAGDPGVDPIPGKFGKLNTMPTEEQLADPAFALDLSLHNLLPFLGMAIGEFFDLDALAADCAADGDWYCQLTSAPLQVPGGVATPANAVAVR